MVRILLTLLLTCYSGLLTAQSSALNSATENNEVILVTSINKDQVYVQEELIFSIKLYYTLAFERGAQFSRPEMSEAATSRLGESLTYTEIIDGVRYAVNENRFAIFPQNSGTFTIDPIRFRGYTQTRATRDNPDLQTTETRDLIELESNAHQLTVLPVPASFPGPNWLPSSDVSVTESWSQSPASLRIGDSVVRSIHVKAEDLFASMLLNLDFTSDSSLRQYADPAEQVDIRENHGTRSEHIQNISLVATQAGQITLPEIEIPWWNTDTDTLEYATLPARTVDILTAEGLRLEPETETGSAQEPDGILSSINLNLIIFVGMLVLVLALFFAPVLILLSEKLRQSLQKVLGLSSHTKRLEAQHLKNVNTAFKALRHACEKQDIKTVYESFLDWGRAYFQNPALYSLDKLDRAFNDEELSMLLAGMRKCLYRSTKADSFDFQKFLLYVSGLHNARKQRFKPRPSNELPPLYHN